MPIEELSECPRFNLAPHEGIPSSRTRCSRVTSPSRERDGFSNHAWLYLAYVSV
jgi:hypothetical protein